MLVIVLNIYDPTDGSGFDFTGRLSTPANPYLSKEDYAKAYYLLSRMNAELLKFALRGKYVPLDIHSHFLGHGLSTKGGKWSFFVQRGDRSYWYDSECMVDVNAEGAHELRKMLWKAVEPWASKRVAKPRQ